MNAIMWWGAIEDPLESLYGTTHSEKQIAAAMAQIRNLPYFIADAFALQSMIGCAIGKIGAPVPASRRLRGLTMICWQGHYPATREALLGILVRASSGCEAFSRRERALYIASEFWAAVASRTLDEHLEIDAAEKLHQSWAAFLILDASKIANVVGQVAQHPNQLTTKRSPRSYAANIERRIRRASCNVDQMLSDCAGKANGLSPVSSPDVAVEAPDRSRIFGGE